jgi:hypothetical protein
MTEQYSIKPPPELVQQWTSFANEEDGLEVWTRFAVYAAQWGADQELEACCKWFQEFYKTESWVDLDLRTFRAARRPKTPSLKEQAMCALIDGIARGGNDPSDIDTIRRALEALPDD